MPARGYEFYLQVVDISPSERSERVRYRVEHVGRLIASGAVGRRVLAL